MTKRYLFVFLLMVSANRQTFSQTLYGKVIKTDAQTFGLVKDAIQDFQYQLSKGTGKDFNIDTKDSTVATGIQLIKLDRAINSNYDKRLDPNNDDAVLIQSDGEHILKIIAYTRQGLINGIYTYLDTLGFRWYHPGEEWAYAPKLQGVGFKCDKVYKPDFVLRTFFGTFGTPRIRPIDKNFEIDKQWNIWSMRNRLGGGYQLKGHAWPGFLWAKPGIFTYFSDYMALVNGVRVKADYSGRKFCVSNEGFQKMFTDYMVDQLNKLMKADSNGRIYIISVEPSDGEGDCECDACKKMGSVSTRDFYLANIVAKAFQKISPKAYVNLYAYNTHAAPPDLELEPNVIVQIIPYWYQHYAPAQHMIEEWKKKSDNLFIYDYYGLPILNLDMPLHNVLAPWRFAERIKYWHDQNIKGMNLESSYSIGATGIGLYLYARLGWDAHADEWQILKEYYHRCYGAAYDAVWFAQLALADDSLEKSQTLINVMRKLHKETTKLKLSTEEKAHLTDFKAYTHYLKLLYEMQRTDPHGDTVAVDNLLRYTYGIYFRKEVHPTPVSNWLASYSHSREFVKKYWTVSNKPAPIDKFPTVVQLTDEEINALFEEDCKEKR